MKPGDVVLDCFAGVALGARDAMAAGLNWCGVELEPRFCELGNQNIDLWNRLGERAVAWNLPAWGSATLVQGDSRFLSQILSMGAGASVSSPPYAESLSQGNDATSYDYTRYGGGGQLAKSQRYGDDPTNLGNLPAGNFDAVVASPPYADGCSHTGGDDPNPQHIQGGAYHGVGIHGAISSPPYAESLASDDPDKRGGLFKDPKRRNDKTLTAEYGNSEGQLGAMPPGQFGGVVSSPPYEASHVGAEDNPYVHVPGGQLGNAQTGHLVGKNNYGSSPGQLGSESGDDFWSAAKLIMQEVYSVLPEGAVAIWVLKAFVRKGRYVDFPDQWRQLGEGCGFHTLEWIRAWLIEDRGTQYTLDGGSKTKTIKRASFFRKLAEAKGAPPIDFEVVLVQRKWN